MPDVITWSLVGGSIVFIIGLISARASRRQTKSKRQSSTVIRDSVHNSANDSVPRKSAMSMAAGGAGNGEENLAAVGNRPS